MKGLSLLIPTYNCASSLERALVNSDLFDEIVIIDSFSNDETLKVAEKFGAKIIQRSYDTPSNQKNWALDHCSKNWILQLDSDEEISRKDILTIKKIISNPESETKTVWLLSRKNHVLGKWCRFGGLFPDYQTRLFQNGKAIFNNKIVHEKLESKGDSGIIPNVFILHYGMPNISKQVKNLDRYTRYEADELKKKGKRFTYIKWLVFPWLIFFYRYLWQQGFRDGWRGFFLAAYNGFYYFLAQTKLRELEELQLDKSP